MGFRRQSQHDNSSLACQTQSASDKVCNFNAPNRTQATRGFEAERAPPAIKAFSVSPCGRLQGKHENIVPRLRRRQRIQVCRIGRTTQETLSNL
eukprot:3932877-Rhodomonas_salina.1